MLDVSTVAGLPREWGKSTVLERRATVALWAICPPRLRPTKARLAEALGCSVVTLKRDLSHVSHSRLTRSLSVALWGAFVLAAVRRGLAHQAALAAQGDAEALRVCADVCAAVGLDASALLGGSIAGVTLERGPGALPAAHADMLATAWAALLGDPSLLDDGGDGGGEGAPPVGGAAGAPTFTPPPHA